MIDRIGLHELDRSAASDGQVVQWDAATQMWKPATPTPLGVQSVTAGNSAVVIDNTDPAHLIISAYMPLTTEVGGVPDLVWDDDNQLVMTVAP